MDSSKKRQVSEQVRRLRARFAQAVGALLGDVIPQQLVMQLVSEEAGGWRERVYGPLTTLVAFIEQELSADRSCQHAVARGVSARVALVQAPCSLNTGAYCKARSRLALGLLELGARGGCPAVRGAAWAVALARSRSQARRWHHGVDARHAGQPGELPAEP